MASTKSAPLQHRAQDRTGDQRRIAPGHRDHSAPGTAAAPPDGQARLSPLRRTAGAVDAALGSVFKWTNLIGVCMIVGMMALTTVDVALRYFLRAPILGTVEIVQFLLVVTVFFGLAHTQRSGGNISAEILVDMLPKRAQAAIDAFTGLLALGVYATMAWVMVVHVLGPGGLIETSDMLEIPVWPFKILAACGVALLSLELAASVIRNLALAVGARREEETS